MSVAHRYLQQHKYFKNKNTSFFRSYIQDARPSIKFKNNSSKLKYY